MAKVLAETWLLGANAEDPDARKAMATRSKAETNRMEDMVGFLIVSRRKSDCPIALTVSDQKEHQDGRCVCVIRQCVT